MAKRRFHRCEGPFNLKRDADIEARLIRETGHKAKVKRRGSHYEVCRSYSRKRSKRR